MTHRREKSFEQAARLLSPNIRDRLLSLPTQLKAESAEIRLNSGAPVNIFANGRLISVGQALVSDRDMHDCLLTLTENSFHSHQRELTEGFISLPGGHRAGIAATASYSADSVLQGIRDVNAVVLRIAHPPDEGSFETARNLISGGLCGMLIAGPPGSGKTTLLRAVSDLLAERGERVVMIDERGELLAEHAEICRLTGYEKSVGIIMALRSLSPDVIICDELGGEDDAKSILWALNCGVPVIGSAHACSVSELFARKGTNLLIKTGAFSRIAVLDKKNVGKLLEVTDGDGKNHRRTHDSDMRCDDRHDDGRQRTAQDIIDRACNTFPFDGETEASLFDDEDEQTFAVCL